MISRFHCIIIFFLFFSSCITPQKTEKTERNISYIYNPNSSYIHPEYEIYHKNDSITHIYVRIKTNELLFNQANPDNILSSHLTFHYELFETKDTADRAIADTGKYDFDIPIDDKALWYYTRLSCRANNDKSYVLRIFLFDRMRDYWLQTFFHVDKRNRKNSQNFLLLSKNKKSIFFGKIVLPTDTFIIESNRNPDWQKCYVCLYKKIDRYSPVEAGVVSEMIQNPDSCWQTNISDSMGLNFSKEGSYVIRKDSAAKGGLLIHQFGKNYPDIRNVNEMIGPLAYLTSVDEYRQIILSQKTKIEIDNFWLKAGGTNDRARELIRIYYNRVKYSNIYFTSDREGWKTDRGMIYMLFGPPAKLFKSDNEEKWIYFQNTIEVPFIFQKRENPYTTNDYILKPGSHIESEIDNIIDLWIQGKII